MYTALFTEYVQRLIADWSPIEFFIEGKRSRTGKSLHPKFGLLNICVEPFLQKKIPGNFQLLFHHSSLLLLLLRQLTFFTDLTVSPITLEVIINRQPMFA